LSFARGDLMRIKRIIIGVLIGTVIGLGLEYVNSFMAFLMPPFFFFLPLTVIIGGCFGAIVGANKYNRLISKGQGFEHLPVCVADFMRRVIKKMRYRKKVREDVQAELTGHFEDELKVCTTDEEREQKAQHLIGEFGDVKLLAILLRRAKKRCRPLWRTMVVRTFQTVGVLILCFVLYTVWFLTGKPTVRIDYLAQLNQMGRPQISDEDNAWPHYERAIELYVEPSAELDGIPALRSWNKPAYRSFAALSEQERQEIGKWVWQNEAAWEQFAAASLRSYCYQEYMYGTDNPDYKMLLSVLLPHIPMIREMVKVGIWRSRMLVERGETALALDDCLAVARAGSHWQGSGTLVEQLVGLVISRTGYEEILQIAATKDISAADLKQLQQQLTQIYPGGYPLMNVEGERLVFWDMVQHTFTDGGPGGGHLIPRRLLYLDDVADIGLDSDELILSTAVGMIHARRDQTIRIGNEIYDRLSGISKMTPYKRKINEVIDGEDIISALPMFRYSLIRAFIPSLSRACEYAYRGRALHEATVTVLVLKRWRLEKGQYPLSLSELVTAGYLEQVPMDPYSDKALVYKKTDDSFVLYSLGPDFDDDGGVENPEDSQKRRQEGPGDEVFWPVPQSQSNQ